MQIPTYPFDSSGQSLANRIENEVVEFSVPQAPVLRFNGGLFYTDSFNIATQADPNTPLVLGTDFQFALLDPIVVTKTGKPAAAMVEVIDSNITGPFVVTYQLVGGKEGTDSILISMLIEQLTRVDNGQITWDQIDPSTIPSSFTPGEHNHDILTDLTNLQVLSHRLNDLTDALLSARKLSNVKANVDDNFSRVFNLVAGLRKDLNQISVNSDYSTQIQALADAITDNFSTYQNFATATDASQVVQNNAINGLDLRVTDIEENGTGIESVDQSSGAMNVYVPKSDLVDQGVVDTTIDRRRYNLAETIRQISQLVTPPLNDDTYLLIGDMQYSYRVDGSSSIIASGGAGQHADNPSFYKEPSGPVTGHTLSADQTELPFHTAIEWPNEFTPPAGETDTITFGFYFDKNDISEDFYLLNKDPVSNNNPAGAIWYDVSTDRINFAPTNGSSSQVTMVNAGDIYLVVYSVKFQNAIDELANDLSDIRVAEYRITVYDDSANRLGSYRSTSTTKDAKWLLEQNSSKYTGRRGSFNGSGSMILYNVMVFNEAITHRTVAGLLRYQKKQSMDLASVNAVSGARDFITRLYANKIAKSIDEYASTLPVSEQTERKKYILNKMAGLKNGLKVPLTNTDVDDNGLFYLQLTTEELFRDITLSHITDINGIRSILSDISVTNDGEILVSYGSINQYDTDINSEQANYAKLEAGTVVSVYPILAGASGGGFSIGHESPLPWAVVTDGLDVSNILTNAIDSNNSDDIKLPERIIAVTATAEGTPIVIQENKDNSDLGSENEYDILYSISEAKMRVADHIGQAFVKNAYSKKQRWSSGIRSNLIDRFADVNITQGEDYYKFSPTSLDVGRGLLVVSHKHMPGTDINSNSVPALVIYGEVSGTNAFNYEGLLKNTLSDKERLLDLTSPFNNGLVSSVLGKAERKYAKVATVSMGTNGNHVGIPIGHVVHKICILPTELDYGFRAMILTYKTSGRMVYLVEFNLTDIENITTDILASYSVGPEVGTWDQETVERWHTLSINPELGAGLAVSHPSHDKMGGWMWTAFGGSIIEQDDIGVIAEVGSTLKLTKQYGSDKVGVTEPEDNAIVTVSRVLSKDSVLVYEPVPKMLRIDHRDANGGLYQQLDGRIIATVVSKKKMALTNIEGRNVWRRHGTPPTMQRLTETGDYPANNYMDGYRSDTSLTNLYTTQDFGPYDIGDSSHPWDTGPAVPTYMNGEVNFMGKSEFTPINGWAFAPNLPYINDMTFNSGAGSYEYNSVSGQWENIAFGIEVLALEDENLPETISANMSSAGQSTAVQDAIANNHEYIVWFGLHNSNAVPTFGTFAGDDSAHNEMVIAIGTDGKNIYYKASNFIFIEHDGYSPKTVFNIRHTTNGLTGTNGDIEFLKDGEIVTAITGQTAPFNNIPVVCLGAKTKGFVKDIILQMKKE